jgi:hypothetical protein
MTVQPLTEWIEVFIIASKVGMVRGIYTASDMPTVIGIAGNFGMDRGIDIAAI